MKRKKREEFYFCEIYFHMNQFHHVIEGREKMGALCSRAYLRLYVKSMCTIFQIITNTSLAQLLWRLARFCYKTGKYHATSRSESRKLAERGWGYIEKALDAGGRGHNDCRRWAGILLSWSSEFEGYKKKIEKSFEIKEHFLVGTGQERIG